MYYTTLNRIRANNPCKHGWKNLLKGLGKTRDDDEPLSLLRILQINGIEDAIWALRAIDDCPEIRLYGVRCVRQVQHLLCDERSFSALDVSELFAIGESTVDELAAARAAAWDAALAATMAASTAASTAASAAARAAALEARAAAWEAASAAWDAARDAARDAQREDFVAIFCQED